MIQAFSTAFHEGPSRPASAAGNLSDADPWAPLLRLSGPLHDTHVLIVAERSMDLMCRLIRYGCLAATTLRPGEKPDYDEYRLIVVPDTAAFASFDQVVQLARHVLMPRGRLIATVADSHAAMLAARRLRLNGFTAIRPAHVPDGILLRADLRSVS